MTDASSWSVSRRRSSRSCACSSGRGASGWSRTCALETPVASRPRRRAAATSIAGPPSDAWRGNQPGARFLYRDEGKRYRFELRGGVAVAVHPDGRETSITQAVSYNRRRRGEPIALPVLDQIAADGGRILAKEAGVDRFYFATMDETFIHVGDDGREIAPPSTFFKLDPAVQPTRRLPCRPAGALPRMLRRPPGHRAVPVLRGDREPAVGRHDAHAAADRGVAPPRRPSADDRSSTSLLTGIKWMLMDLPPVAQIARQIPGAATAAGAARRAATRSRSTPRHPSARGAAVPTYIASTFEKDGHRFEVPGRRLRRGARLGVGHGHWHEQYDGTTGGEMQRCWRARLIPGGAVSLTFADLYRFVNGPVADGDGFIDGTANFYALVHLRGTTGTRCCTPTSSSTSRIGGGSPTPTITRDAAVGHRRVARLAGLPVPVEPDRLLVPVPRRLIRSYSRLAVSRQVALVTSFDPRDPSPIRTRSAGDALRRRRLQHQLQLLERGSQLAVAQRSRRRPATSETTPPRPPRIAVDAPVPTSATRRRSSCART